MNTATPMLSKGERLTRLYDELKKKPPARSPSEAWTTVSDELALIEQDYAPAGSEKMKILPLDNWMVQPYGPGGFYIPLINGDIRINANGAVGIYNSYTGAYELQKAGADGNAFSEVPGWKYDFNVSKTEKPSSSQPKTIMEQTEEPDPELQPWESFVDSPLEEITATDDMGAGAALQNEPFRFWWHFFFFIMAVVVFLVVPAFGKTVIPEHSQRYLWVLGQHGITAVTLGALLAIGLRVTKSTVGLWGAPSTKIIILGFSTVTAAYLFDATYTFAMGIPQEPWMANLFFGLNGLQTSVLITTLLVFPPLTEELLFRYFFVELMPYRRSKWWTIGTVFVTSFMFAAMHALQYQKWPTLILMFALGAVFAIARIASRGLGLPLLLHSYAIVLGLLCNWLMN